MNGDGKELIYSVGRHSHTNYIMRGKIRGEGHAGPLVGGNCARALNRKASRCKCVVPGLVCVCVCVHVRLLCSVSANGDSGVKSCPLCCNCV